MPESRCSKPVGWRGFVIMLLLLIIGTYSTFAQLQAGFNADKTEGCSPLTVNFANTTTGASTGASYHWDFGNGNVSTLKDPGAIFTAEKNHTVILTVTDAGKTSTRSIEIRVYSKPEADFTPSVITGCSPLEVDFKTDIKPGGGNNFSYYWDFGDGHTLQSGSGSIKHIYQQQQDATVSITIKNNYGCAATVVKKNIIKVLPTLKSIFEADKKVLCQANDPVQFTNKSVGSGTLTYAWDFGNGQNSNLKDPLYVYPTKGTYDVKLTVSSSDGCTTSSVQSINAYNISTEIQLPAVICRSTMTDVKALCTPLPLKFDWIIDGTPVADHNQNIQFQFATIGSHSIQLIADYGTCQQTITKTFDVKEIPSVTDFDLKLNTYCNLPAKAEVKDLSTEDVKWEWSFEYYGPSSRPVDARTKDATYEYNSYGTRNILMRAYNADGCFKDVVKPVTIDRIQAGVGTLTANPFRHIESCGPITLGFKSYYVSNIVKYNWRFDGELSSSTDAEPMREFKTPGYHTVVLEYETDKGCKGTTGYGYSILVTERPKLDFSSTPANSVCGNNPVQFTIAGDVSNANYIQWLANDQGMYFPWFSNFTYQFTDTGVYNIKLIVSKGGCVDTVEKKNYIHVKSAVPRITRITNFCDERDKVEFTQESVDAEKWTWDFGDGQTETLTSDQRTITHRYAATGGYQVKLTVTKGQCVATHEMRAVVLLKFNPKLSASKTVLCGNEPLSYQITDIPWNPGAVTLPPLPPDYYTYTIHYTMVKWEYNDGTPFTGTNSARYPWVNIIPYSGPVLTGLDPSKSSIRLILSESTTQCLDTTNYIPIIMKGATADFQLLTNEICFNTPMQAKDNSTNNAGSVITQVEWDFGDGKKEITQQGASVSHIYDKPGNYAVSIKITDNGGCVSDTKQVLKYVKVNGPVAAFNTNRTTVPRNEFVEFYNSTNDYSYYRAGYLWNFGDGNTSAQPNPKYSFTTEGKYTVTLTATDPVNGCSSSVTKEITVESRRAVFAKTTSRIGQTNCLPLLANFSATTLNSDSLSWDFGDGTTAGNIKFPNHVYDKPGKYIITLSSYSGDGSVGVFKDSIIIDQTQVSLTASVPEACKDQPVNWTVSGQHAQSYTLDFGDGSITSAQNGAAAHSYKNSGTFAPALIMRDVNGCVLKADATAKLVIRPDPNIIVNAVSACLGQSAQIEVSGANTYLWTPAAGLDDPKSARPIATLQQTTNFRVEGTDDIGCRNAKDITVTIHQPFTVALSDAVAICKGDDIVLNATGADRYTWIYNTTGLNNPQSGTPRTTPLANTVYTVVGYDKFGCFTDTAAINITVNPRPVVNAGDDQETEPGDEVFLSATADSDISQWLWSPSTYLSCTNCPSPVSIPQSEMKYTVKATNQYGCAASDEVTVKLLCDESRIRIPNAFTPNNDGKNDRFVIKGITLIKHLVIYNRWGNKVFERSNFIATDMSSCWDGTYNNIPQLAETYVYMAEMQCPKGGIFMKKGTITLIR